MSNINATFFWPSNFLLVGGRLVGSWCIRSVVGWLVVGGQLFGWWVVGWSVVLRKSLLEVT